MSRDQQEKIERTTRRDTGISHLEALLKSYSIVNLNMGYHFRVNNALDLFPTNYRFHNLRTGKRGFYPSSPKKKLAEFIDAQLAEGARAPDPRRPRISAGGTCIFCGQPTDAPFSYICGNCKGKSHAELLHARQPKKSEQEKSV